MEKRIRVALASAVMTLAAVIPAGAYAQAQPAVPKEPAPAPALKASSVTAFAGYRFSSGLSTDNGGSWELTEGPSFAVAADFGIDSKTQWELLVSYRNASLKA